jgi:hypothetical protein
MKINRTLNPQPCGWLPRNIPLLVTLGFFPPRMRKKYAPAETRGERETIFYEIRRLGSWLRYEALPGIGTLCGRVFAFLLVILFVVGVYCILSMLLTPLFAAPVTMGNIYLAIWLFRRRD